MSVEQRAMRLASALPSVPAPRSLDQLAQRAAALTGRSIEELAHELGAANADARDAQPAHAAMTQRKGKIGQLVERALGATAGSLPAPDFVELGVELKTIPTDAYGKPRESTYVCMLSLADADRAEWSTSIVRAKLSHVLFVPIVYDAARVTVGQPLFWRPTATQAAILRADFDDLMGLIALGRIEAITARLGRWLQVRPKAAHGGVRTRGYGLDDEPIAVLPRGFYLRARFTHALLRDPSTTAP